MSRAAIQTEHEALVYIKSHLAIAERFAKEGKRGLYQWHTQLADSATDSLIAYREVHLLRSH